jgi:Mrp family chromosome partitioning ATPase
MRRLVSVSQDDGLALTVSATMRNPARSADVVNALLDDYVIAHALGEQGAGVRDLPAIRVLRHPSVPTAPDKPAASLAGGLGAAAGLAIAVLVRMSRRWAAAARARESVERSLRRAGMNVLGRLDPRAGRSMADALLQSGTGPQMAAMRATRDKLGDAKVVGFVGGQPGPAASAAACAYARAAARDGQHVLLVDGDPEGAFMSRLLGEPRGRLSDVLRGEAEWRDCVTHDRVEGLDTLVGPTHGAGARRLGAVIDQAVTVYDQIVLGAPKGTRLPRCDRAVTVLDGGEAVVLAGKGIVSLPRLRGYSECRPNSPARGPKPHLHNTVTRRPLLKCLTLFLPCPKVNHVRSGSRMCARPPGEPACNTGRRV